MWFEGIYYCTFCSFTITVCTTSMYVKPSDRSQGNLKIRTTFPLFPRILGLSETDPHSHEIKYAVTLRRSSMMLFLHTAGVSLSIKGLVAFVPNLHPI